MLRILMWQTPGTAVRRGRWIGRDWERNVGPCAVFQPTIPNTQILSSLDTSLLWGKENKKTKHISRRQSKASRYCKTKVLTIRGIKPFWKLILSGLGADWGLPSNKRRLPFPFLRSLCQHVPSAYATLTMDSGGWGRARGRSGQQSEDRLPLLPQVWV